MKAKYLDAVIAAGRASRSVALATDLQSGAQLLLDGDRFDGELALDDAPRAAMREALRADRNLTP
jgi:xanthine dehydrogenase accessory factor